MVDSLLWLAAHFWKSRVPLTDQWARMKPDQRDPHLAIWIPASETDKWTRVELRSLFIHCMDTGAIPPVLQAWMNDDSAGRLKPIRRGPRPDHASDYRITAMVETRKLIYGETDHAARRAVAEERNSQHPQYDKVRGAHERGGRGPPEVWPNSQ